MAGAATSRSDVLIVGAGPTGLVLALWLTRQGAKVCLLDRTDGPVRTSRALAVQSRTLELYRQLDLTEKLLGEGHEVPALNLWVQGRKKARIALQALAQGLTPYGPLICPQDQHERLLVERLAELGVPILRRTELLGFADEGDHVRVALRRPDGREAACEARYLAGCDGAGSTVRQKLGFGFPGGTYQQLFYVADVDAAGPTLDGELHVDLDEADFLAVFPLKGQGRARLIGTVRGERAANAQSMQFEDVSRRAIRHMHVEVRQVNWFSTYHVHHRVAEHFRSRRVFLLGDAAHIHSPAGGQGMNTGIGDAVNLAWKLKSVLAGEAPDGLLDTYESERRSFAIRLVATTDRAFTLATAEGRMADFVRTRIVPAVVPVLFGFAAARTYMFRAVSQIGLTYRDSAISEGEAGSVRGGDRLPFVPTPAGDNYDAFRTICWQLHVYGVAAAELESWCRNSGLALHAFPWQSSYERSGLVEDAMYLIRPDTYVALAAREQDPRTLARYFTRHALQVVAGMGDADSIA